MKPSLGVLGDGEISALIATLHRTGQRLELLTAGEVDSVIDSEGRTFLLQSAQERLRHIEATKQAAVLNALPAHIALLNAAGVIVSVNDAWRTFGQANAAHGPGHGVGVDYLAVCDEAMGEDAVEARQAAEGIRAVLAGTETECSLEYPCHAPTAKRWFLMRVKRLAEDSASGVIVMHIDITERTLSGLEVIAAKNQLQGTLDAIPDLLFELGLDGRYYDYHSPRMELLVATPEEMIGRTIVEVLPPDAAKVVFSALQDAHANGLSSGKQFELDMPQGRKWFELSVSRKAAAPGQDPRFICLSRDITPRKLAEIAIQRLSRGNAVLSQINGLIVRVRDRDELFKEACRIAVEVGGFRMAWIGVVNPTSHMLVGAASAGFKEGVPAVEDRSTIQDNAPRGYGPSATAVRERKPVLVNNVENETQILKMGVFHELGVRSLLSLPLMIDDAIIGALSLYASEVDHFDDEEVKLLCELADDIAFANDHIEKQDRLDYLAYYDELTGLANRRLFLERVGQFIRSAVTTGHALAVFLVDLERFKSFNDSFGTPRGDALLRHVAKWLTHSSGDASRLARVGADQFAVVVPDVMHGADVARLLVKLMESLLEHPFRVADDVLRVTAKAGVALFPQDGEEADGLFRKAEAALKNAKTTGDRYLFYTQRMTEDVATKLTLEIQLRRAIEREEFVLHYQPKMSFETGKLTSVEALIRWRDPSTGLVPPGEFVPVLEETGLIHQVGRWAIRKAIADYLRWKNAGLPAVRVAVNVSPLQLRSETFIAELEEDLAVDSNAAAGLELEITESLIMADVQLSIATLRAVRAMGVTIAIDDFGTGYSSLSYLAKLPVDAVKIDRSFVVAMTLSSQGQSLVATIINMAHSLKLSVVAEGVETEEQAQLLRLLGCDEMQGFLISKALKSEQLEARFLARGVPELDD